MSKLIKLYGSYRYVGKRRGGVRRHRAPIARWWWSW